MLVLCHRSGPSVFSSVLLKDIQLVGVVVSLVPVCPVVCCYRTYHMLVLCDRSGPNVSSCVLLKDIPHVGVVL